ncbi:CARDB domain-containing protein [Natrialbaceae archaeon A-arb3/5]
MPSSNTLLTLAVVCLLVTLVVPTAAVSVGEDTAADDVVLEPASSHYATVVDDELRLDLAALNERTETAIDAMFAITVTDDAVAQVWIDHDIDGLTFYANGDRPTPVSESTPIVPATGETVTIGVEVDTHTASNGTESFDVHVAYEDEEDGESASDTAADGVPGEKKDHSGTDLDDRESGPAIEQMDIEMTPTRVEPGETVVVNATYENGGNETGETVVGLTVDDSLVDDRAIELAPNESETVRLTWTATNPGTYDLGVDGVSAGTVTVTEPEPFAIENRELAASTTAALAPPAAAVGLTALVTAVGRRRR